MRGARLVTETEYSIRGSAWSSARQIELLPPPEGDDSTSRIPFGSRVIGMRCYCSIAARKRQRNFTGANAANREIHPLFSPFPPVNFLNHQCHSRHPHATPIA